MLKLINRIDNVLSKNLTNTTVTYVVILLGLLYVFMIKRVPTKFLKLVNQTPSKVLVALLIAYLSCLDPILAVGLTTLFILSLHFAALHIDLCKIIVKGKSKYAKKFNIFMEPYLVFHYLLRIQLK